MKFLSKIPSWVKNKYLLTGLAFIVWMCFFDANDIALQQHRRSELKKLQNEERMLDKQITQTKQELDLLKTSPSTIEKYAREKYLMKRDNEDLYLVNKK
jgi:cell division protein DivIC